MTALAELLVRRIAATGPITIADYMTECLLHPRFGYYTSRDPFGAAGDFTTAPEISQMFGEVIGLCLAQAWVDQGRPGRFTLAEPGPGRGTLMADILRATRAVPGFHEAAALHLIEPSPILRQRQQDTIGRSDVTWCHTVNDLPAQPIFLVANEFFDALPIRQFKREQTGWRERMVGAKDGKLVMGLSAPLALPDLDHRLADTAPGDLVETCAPAARSAASVAARIARHGGAALVIDYGDWRSLGDTLQAVRGHRPDGILAHPGEADLTAHVDFEALGAAAIGVAHTKLTTQGVFLERLGITRRAQMLAQSLAGDALDAHVAAHRRLTHPQEMGSLFKAVAFYPIGLPPPPGLEP
jgi:SAM-dependent MidA family methyltransferase